MPDMIEKVTKGLECHKNGSCQIDDKTSCPYWECEKDCSKHLMTDALELLKEQQPKWIPVSEGLPEERDTMFARFKGTDKWNPAMPEKMSDVVTVAVLVDGTKRIKHTRMIDGKWEVENKPIKQVVTHWMPNPALPKDGEQE